MKNKWLIIFLLCTFTSCALQCRVDVLQKYAPTKEVSVVQMGQTLPSGVIRMGSVTVGEGGMTPTEDCTYEACMRAVIEQAKNVGADIVYIVQVISPSDSGGVAYGYGTGPVYYGGGSSCYGIVAELYKKRENH